jgi:hypothetical protein
MSISFTPSQTLAIVEATMLHGTPWNDGYTEATHRQACLVVRALSRFEREYGWYSAQKGPMSEVRSFHRMLIDEVNLFISLRRKDIFSEVS